MTRFSEVPSTFVRIGLPSIRTSTAGCSKKIILGGFTSSSRMFSLSFCAVSILSRSKSREKERSNLGIISSNASAILAVSASVPAGNLILRTSISSSFTVRVGRSVITLHVTQIAPNTGSSLPIWMIETAARAFKESPEYDSICG